MTESRLDYLLKALRTARKSWEDGNTCSLVWARERQEIVRMAEEWEITDLLLDRLYFSHELPSLPEWEK